MNLKTSGRILILISVFMFALNTSGCGPNDGGVVVEPETTLDDSEENCPRIETGDCDVAIVLTIDISGSMDEDTGGGTTVLDRIKDAIVHLLRYDIPTGQWNLGMTTFPGETVPEWGLNLITDDPDTRGDAIDFVYGLDAEGPTDIYEAGYEALSMLQTDPVRPPILVFMTDGIICLEEGCPNVILMADHLKASGVFIITIGYRLEGTVGDTATPLGILDNIASERPDGTKAFNNAASGSELFDLITEEIGDVCKYFPLALDIMPIESRVAAGGVSSVEVVARYRFGPAATYYLTSYFSGYPEIEIENLGSDFELGPSTCEYRRKVTVETNELAEPRLYNSLFISAIDYNNPVTRVNRQVLVKVTDFDLRASFLESPDPPYWLASGEFFGYLELVPDSTEEAEVSVSINVRKAGEADIASGWASSIYPDWKFPVYPETDVSLGLTLTPPPGVEPGEIYFVEVTIISEGKHFQVEPYEIIIPGD